MRGTLNDQSLIYLQIARMLETTSSGASIRRSRSPAPMSWSGSSRNSTDRKWPAHLTVRGPFCIFQRFPYAIKEHTSWAYSAGSSSGRSASSRA